MTLGNFSISLAVKDINASKEFYEKLGFTQFDGSLEQQYLIMKNEKAIVSLFQGMFENNIITFNPGWDENAQKLDHFDDVRTIQHELLQSGIKIENAIDESSTGPAHIMVLDPDGNAILIDQHV